MFAFAACATNITNICTEIELSILANVLYWAPQEHTPAGVEMAGNAGSIVSMKADFTPEPSQF